MRATEAGQQDDPQGGGGREGEGRRAFAGTKID
jgi:hypothetical protein